ncbi:MAG: helix-turn-helix transcriptional regulator [Clostridia bacterium]|nr:helix-turn-helix transcriptional regulator [Clostridia bacterium]
MLSENIKAIRKSKGLSQEELAVKLNVVRQTISKWEQGLSVPDAYMLISLSEALDTPVSVLLGEIVEQPELNDLKVISEKLEIINLQLALSRKARQKKLIVFFSLLVIAIITIFALLIKLDSPYLEWDYSDPEIAVVGVLLHAFEWIFVRLSPLALIGAIAGVCLVVKKKKK